MCHCSSAHPRHCSGFQPLFLPWCQHPLMPSSHSTDKKLDPSLRASAPSWLPRHLLGSQTRVLCPCGPLQSRARARPGSQPSPSLTQVWLKEPQHVCVLNPNSLLHQPAPSRGCKGKAWTLLPLFLTPTPDTRGFQWWRFQMRAWGRRIHRKRLPSAGDGGRVTQLPGVPPRGTEVAFGLCSQTPSHAAFPGRELRGRRYPC